MREFRSVVMQLLVRSAALASGARRRHDGLAWRGHVGAMLEAPHCGVRRVGLRFARRRPASAVGARWPASKTGRGHSSMRQGTSPQAKHEEDIVLPLLSPTLFYFSLSSLRHTAVSENQTGP